MTCKLTALLAGIGALAFAAPTHAQLPPGPHFTFTVPVRLDKLPPEILRYSVSCAVLSPGSSGIMARGETNVRLGEGVPITGGSLNTDVVVPVTVTDPLADPSLATEYICSLYLMGVAPPGGPPSASITYLDDSNTRFPVVAGRLFRQSYRGTLPSR